MNPTRHKCWIEARVLRPAACQNHVRYGVCCTFSTFPFFDVKFVSWMGKYSDWLDSVFSFKLYAFFVQPSYLVLCVSLELLMGLWRIHVHDGCTGDLCNS
ncbi:hypothetical protein F2P56_009970 [Juglans regia]|uniref:Uncharacterized protein n=1 Tax=Juglans regia TaxID=51240 RepID=A0A833XXD0_JUGRE|nr:hypothetical protein F2P56_009970 [Juglans regia]